MDKENENNLGRPLKFKTPEELQEKVDEYFKDNDRITLSGLAVHLDIDRQTLYNYKKRDDFFDIIKRATTKVESKFEELLAYEPNPAGKIFILKNMGWSDKQEIKQDNTGDMNINITRKTI